MPADSAAPARQAGVVFVITVERDQRPQPRIQHRCFKDGGAAGGKAKGPDSLSVHPRVSGEKINRRADVRHPLLHNDVGAFTFAGAMAVHVHSQGRNAFFGQQRAQFKIVLFELARAMADDQTGRGAAASRKEHSPSQFIPQRSQAHRFNTDRHDALKQANAMPNGINSSEGIACTAPWRPAAKGWDSGVPGRWMPRGKCVGPPLGAAST